MFFRAASRVRRAGAMSWRQAATVLCALVVVSAMIVIADAAQTAAQRHQHLQVLVDRVATEGQQIAAITWQGVAFTRSDGHLTDPAVIRRGLTVWTQVNSAFQALRAADSSPATLALTRDVRTVYADGMRLIATAHEPDGRRVLPIGLMHALDALQRDTGAASAAQQRVTDRSSNQARLAYLGSLLAGLIALGLLGLTLHRMRRAAGINDERRALERNSEQRIRALVENSSDIITVVGRDLVVRWQSPSVRRVLGYAPEQLLGAALTDLAHPADVALVEGQVAAVSDEATATFTARFRDSGGAWRHLEAIVENRLADPLVDGVILSLRDISERQALQEELRHQAFHDALTGLANRALFEDRLTHALAGARRSGRPIAVLFLDLDDFKTINDSLGHAVGDELLRAVARRIAAVVRVTDTPARIGGDEFAVLLEIMDERAEADAVAKRLLEALSAPLPLGGRELRVAASIGLAHGDGSISVEELLRNADTAMYAAKAAGKGTAQAYEPGMHERVLDRLELTGELQRGLDRDEFEVDYQPIVELADGRIVGAEALVRWAHPARGRLAPQHFIGLAEETGLIVALGRWVLHTACSQAAAWQAAFPERGLYINVNVSTRQLHEPDFPDTVAQALAASGLDGSRLVLEITESVLPEDSSEIIAQLHALKALGVRVAVDDFGSGYSALSRLQAYPVDILKIDRAFIAGIEDDADEGQLVQGIVKLGETLRLQIVAEGIEQRGQADQLRQMRSPLGQGFLFSRPVSATALEALLRDGQPLSDGAAVQLPG